MAFERIQASACTRRCGGGVRRTGTLWTMHARRPVPALAVFFAAAAIGLTGCSGSSATNSAESSSNAPNPQSSETSKSAAGSEDAVCDVLTSDTSLSSTVFSPAIPGMTDLSRVEAQNALLAQIEQPPAGLETEWATWMDYREFAAANFDSDPGAIVTKFGEPEVTDASAKLVDFYTGTCL